MFVCFFFFVPYREFFSYLFKNFDIARFFCMSGMACFFSERFDMWLRQSNPMGITIGSALSKRRLDSDTEYGPNSLKFILKVGTFHIYCIKSMQMKPSEMEM